MIGGVEMKMRTICQLTILIIFVFCSFISASAIAQDEKGCSWIGPEGNVLPFSNDLEVEQFMLTAQPVSLKIIRTGVNTPWKVVLEKDGVEACCIFRFQTDRVGRMRIDGVKRYVFDRYDNEVAAYQINKILGMDNMPPTTYRELKGRQGSIQLWLEGTMSNLDRNKNKIMPPDPRHWNQQFYDMRVFDNLINNVDRNQANILIDKDWKLWLIDHTRSFSTDKTLPNPKVVTRCSRRLWEAINQIDEKVVRESLNPHLRESEVDAFFLRHKELVELIEKRIKEMGEKEVLFE